MKILIDLGDYDQTPTIADVLVDVHSLISIDVNMAVACSELIED